MPPPLESHKNEQPSTYFVQDRHNEEELVRVTTQDRLLTASMGGVLPEQPDPTRFGRVLDVGCGSGSWVIEAAQAYSTMSLCGIDISQRMVEYARQQAQTAHLSDRITFQIMDALRMLEFPAGFFDLVNLRLGGSFLRTWDWPKLLWEFQRITRPGAVIRVTDADISQRSNSAALTRLWELFCCAMDRSGHLFTSEPTGITAHLARLLTQLGYQQVQTTAYPLAYRAGTAEGEAFYEDMSHFFRTIRPFLQKWGCLANTYETIYQQALDEMRHPAFVTTWNLLTVWGTRR